MGLALQWTVASSRSSREFSGTDETVPNFGPNSKSVRPYKEMASFDSGEDALPRNDGTVSPSTLFPVFPNSINQRLRLKHRSKGATRKPGRPAFDRSPMTLFDTRPLDETIEEMTRVIIGNYLARGRTRVPADVRALTINFGSDQLIGRDV